MHTERKASHIVKTTCCYCGVGCGIEAQTDKSGRVSVSGDKDHPVNKGLLCSKGMNLHYTVNEISDRLLYPEMRYAKNQPRKRVTWDEALDRTAAVFKTLINKFGPDSVAIYASGQCLTEEYYVLNKLMKGYIRSNNIDTNSRLCMSAAVMSYKMSLGEDSVPVTYADIELTDCLFVTGANPAWCHPVLWRRVEAAKAKNPALKIIVSDPRKTQSAGSADLHLQINPGTDIVLHNAIGRCLLEEGWADASFLREHVDGFAGYCEMVMKRTISDAATTCGITEDQLRQAASWIGNANAFLSMWTMGLNQSTVGVQKNLSLINLHLVTGQIGKPGAGPMSLTGQPNAMGGREVGGMSTMLPAHRDLANCDHRNEVEKFWNIAHGSIASTPGLTATEMFDALASGSLKAIWIICTNPLVSLPDARNVESALKKARYVVVQDISSRSATIPYADVVLPAAGWLEKEGTMTNGERRITLLQKLIDPPGEALPDAEIICRFAARMGFPGFDYGEPEAIFLEHAALTKGTNMDISGLSYELLRSLRSVQWPFLPASTHGSERLFTDKRFYTATAKASLHHFDAELEMDPRSPDYPLILTTGRIRDQWHSMTKTGKVNKLKQHTATAELEIHPEDAESRGINNGSLVQIKSSQGVVRLKCRYSFNIKQGVVFLPMHWGKIAGSDLHRANNLIASNIDPISKEPNFKFTAVQVSRFQQNRRRIIVIGGGAGAFGFMKNFRNLNKDDQIDIFSKEDLPMYNRVLLPDYLTGALTWQSLVKMEKHEEDEYNISYHSGTAIISIDRVLKQVTDSTGHKHHYDILLIATGSRAAELRGLPSIQGIFTMRKRQDADLFRKHISTVPGKVVIAGGGLLGIELAAALNEIGTEVIIIQRISRLMDRQLDPLGSQLLHEELTDKGIVIHYDDEISRLYGNESINRIQLKSGVMLDCSALVVAVGTVPVIDLAREAGLECKRGIEVNEYLRTSDPSIYAVGEIAEFRGFMYGITAAAEEQAAVVASYLNGDISNPYKGSVLMNILKINGMDVCSLGVVEAPAGKGFEEVVFIDKSRRYYKKCVVYNDRLIGAILIGDKSEFLEFRDLIANQTELSEKRLQLLRSGSKAEPVKGKLVCSCAAVGEGNLLAHIAAGCNDLVQLCQLSGAGTGCGSCRPEIKNLLQTNQAAVLV